MGLLGPCWVRWHCVQKSAPQVRQAGVWGGVSHGLSGTPDSGGYGSGSRGERDSGNESEGGWIGTPHPFPLTPELASLGGAEYLPLSPKHKTLLLGCLEPLFSGPESLGGCFHLLPGPLTSRLPPSLLFHPPGPSFPAGGVGVGRKRLPPTTPSSPRPHWPDREAGRGPAFAYAALAAAALRPERAGAEPGTRARLGTARRAVSLGRPGRQRRRNRARGVPGRGRPREWLGLQLGCAPDGPGSPLSGRSSCASQGGRPIGATEPEDRPTTRPPSPAPTGIMTVPKEMPEKWARAGAPPSWSRKKPSWGTGNGRQRLAALPGPQCPLSHPDIRLSSASPRLPRTSPLQTQRSWLRRARSLTLPCMVFGGLAEVSAPGSPLGKFLGAK